MPRILVLVAILALGYILGAKFPGIAAKIGVM